jgi:hypothetical protein
VPGRAGGAWPCRWCLAVPVVPASPAALPRQQRRRASSAAAPAALPRQQRRRVARAAVPCGVAAAPASPRPRVPPTPRCRRAVPRAPPCRRVRRRPCRRAGPPRCGAAAPCASDAPAARSCGVPVLVRRAASHCRIAPSHRTAPRRGAPARPYRHFPFVLGSLLGTSPGVLLFSFESRLTVGLVVPVARRHPLDSLRGSQFRTSPTLPPGSGVGQFWYDGKGVRGPQ